MSCITFKLVSAGTEYDTKAMCTRSWAYNGAKGICVMVSVAGGGALQLYRQPGGLRSTDMNM